MVVHQRWHGEVRHPDFTRLAQHVKVVFLDLGLDRRAFFLPVGHQGVQTDRVQNRTRQDMRPHLRALFQHDHIAVSVELFQTDRGGQTGRARTDDNDVIFHCFAFNFGHLGLLFGQKTVWISLNQHGRYCNRNTA